MKTWTVKTNANGVVTTTIIIKEDGETRTTTIKRFPDGKEIVVKECVMKDGFTTTTMMRLS